jgi:hypothetical protein
MKKVLLACLLGVAALLGQRAARADITFCNNSPNEIWVMYGQVGVNDGLGCNGNNYDEIGWYAVSPNGGCTTAVSGCICNAWSNFWGDCPLAGIDYYANDAYGHYWGGGDEYLEFWTSNEGFHVCTGGDGPPINCSGGSCPPYWEYVKPSTASYSNPSCGTTIYFQ